MADLWKVGIARANVASLAGAQFAVQSSPTAVAAQKLQAAARQGDSKATSQILRGSDKLDVAVLCEALRTAARGGHADVMKQLIDCGADVNAPDDDGYTCFHTACFWGQHSVLPFLAAKGARARSLTKVGRTGWDLASRNGCSRAVAVLTSLGMQETGDHFERVPHAPQACGQSQVGSSKDAEKIPPAVVACGSNLRGQLGCPDVPTSTVMLPVPMPDTLATLPIAFIGCGEGHTLFVAQGGDVVFGCGSNQSGQLGLGRILHENHSSQCDTVIDVVSRPCRVPKLCGLSLAALACGDSHTLALTTAGVVMCCGANKSGQLGLGHCEPEVWHPSANSLTGVTAVAAGSFHSFFLKITDAVWACGNNELGQLGLVGRSIMTPTRVTVLDGHAVVQIACGATQTWFLTKDGSVWHMTGTEWPPAPPPQKLPLPEDDAIVCISAGGFHALFLTASGDCWGFGSNTAGQLGIVSSDGSSISAVVRPTIVEALKRLTHCFVRLSTHGVALAKLGRGCLREGDIGQVISRDASGRRSKVKGGRLAEESWYSDQQIQPADPPSHGNQFERHPSTRVVQVFTGYEHSLMMMADGSIWSCGCNDFGQCGVSLPGSMDGDVGDITFPLRLPVSPGLYALPPEMGCLTSATFLLRKATQVSNPPKLARLQLQRTRSVTVRLHTPPLPRAIAYEDPAVTLAQSSSSSQAVMQTTEEPLAEMRTLQPAELRALIQRQEPWIDTAFPPNPKSLAHNWDAFYNGDEQDVTRGLLWTEIEWKRPAEIKLHSEWESNPQVYVDGVDADDIQQGHLGDCYFLSCLSVLADRPGMVERLILTPTVNSGGVFAARFCKHGAWHDVLIDDYFPCVQRQDSNQLEDKPEDEDRYDAALRNALTMDAIDPKLVERPTHWSPAFSQARDGELWPCILEKAWAKVHGSYQAIEKGDPGSTLRDLTGAPSEFLSCNDAGDTDRSLLWQAMLAADRKGYLMAAGMEAVSPTGGEHRRPDGLIAGHCYGILKIADLDEATHLIKLRNPWGKTEWYGDWSDTSSKWTSELKAKVGFSAKNDGTFWMCLSDFARLFEGVHINRCRPDWTYRFVEHPPVRLSQDCSSTTICFRVVIPSPLSQRDEHAAVLTVSQRDVRAPSVDTERLAANGVSLGHSSTGTNSYYAACTLSAVRVDNEAALVAATATDPDAEARVVIGSSELLQGRDSWLEADLKPGTYVISAHMRLCAPQSEVQIEAVDREVPVVFSCYSPTPATLSVLGVNEAWHAQTEVLMSLTEKLGTADDAMYVHAHRIGEDTRAGEDEARDLSLRVYQCRTLRVFCMLYRNGGGKRPCLLAEEINFTLMNMEVWVPPGDENIDVGEGNVVQLTLAPGESAFLVVRPKSLGKYSLNYSRTVSFEPVD